MQQPPTQQQDTGAGRAGIGLRSDAQQIGSKAANRLHSEVDARKGSAATQVKSVSNAIHSAAGQLDDSAPAWLRSAFQQGAEQIQRFADTLEQKDSRQIFDEVQSFARQRPGLFLGACAAAGFATSRVFKAGGEQRNSEWDQSQPWGDGEIGPGPDESSTQQLGQGGQGTPFIAAGDRGGFGAGQQSARQAESPAAGDPLILGAGTAGGGQRPGWGDDQ
jgi:hypothetical protein